MNSIFWMLGQSGDDFTITVVSAFSPGGALTLSFNEKPVSAQEGLMFQVALALAWAAIFLPNPKAAKPL